MSSEIAALIAANTRIEGIGTLDRLRGLRIRAIANESMDWSHGRDRPSGAR
jgi:hypothetical protein